MKLTISQRQEKLEAIARYDISVLQMSSDKELSELCRDLLPGFSKLNKAQKVEALVKLTEGARARLKGEGDSLTPEITLEQLQDNPEATQEEIERANASLLAIGFDGRVSDNPDNETNLGVYFYKLLKTEINQLEMSQKTDDYLQKLQIIPSSIAARITQHEAKRIETKSVNTQKNRRRQIIKAMENCLVIDAENRNIEVMKTAVEVINRSTYAAIKDEVKEVNLQGKLDSNTRNESPSKISVLRYFQDAYKTINNLDSKDVSREEIYVALAILAGRRPSEIYCSGKFSPHSNYWITFEGQNKKKSKFVAGEKFIMPVFCKSELILKAIEKLEAMTDKHGEPNGRYPLDELNADSVIESNRRADKKFSKPLSRYLKQKDYEFTCREFRAMYGEISYKLDSKSSEAKEIHNLNDPVQSAWFRKVLGHEETSDANAAYTKFNVIDEDEVLSLIQSQRQT